MILFNQKKVSNNIFISIIKIAFPKLQDAILISQNECEQTLDWDTERLNTQTIKSKVDNSAEEELNNIVWTQWYYSFFVNRTRPFIKFDVNCFDVSLIYSLLIK